MEEKGNSQGPNSDGSTSSGSSGREGYSDRETTRRNEHGKGSRRSCSAALQQEKADNVPAPKALNPERVLREEKQGEVPAPAALNSAKALEEEEAGDVPAPKALSPQRALGEEKAGDVPVVDLSPHTMKGQAPTSYNLVVKARMKPHPT